MLSTITDPVPEAESKRSVFEAIVLISLSVMLILPSTVSFGMLTVPVPEGVILMSSFDLVPDILFPLIVIEPKFTTPDPLGTRLRLSFDLVATMLLSSIFIPGNVTAPDPAGTKTTSSFDLFADMLLPEIVMPESTAVSLYNSIKLSLILIMASRRVSPVPSFALLPMSIICLGIKNPSYKFNCNAVVTYWSSK